MRVPAWPLRRRLAILLVGAAHLLALACAPMFGQAGSSGAGVNPGGPIPELPGVCGKAVAVAAQQMGKPYVWGSKGPDSFDCSGLIYYSYGQAGVTIGSSTYTQVEDGQAIPCTLSDLHGADTTCWAGGDLIFLKYPEGQHVAMYSGDGLFLDCYNPQSGCIHHDVTKDKFYWKAFWQARRIVSGCETDAVAAARPQ